MSEIVPAISLWQPWASLLFTPAKPDETRHWIPPRQYIGRRIAIHAAKKVVKDLAPELIEVCDVRLPAGWRTNLPRGAVIGTAVLGNYRRILLGPMAHHSLENITCGDWTPGRFAWRFTDHRLFAQPVPAKGRQMFFNFDLEQADA